MVYLAMAVRHRAVHADYPISDSQQIGFNLGPNRKMGIQRGHPPRDALSVSLPNQEIRFR